MLITRNRVLQSAGIFAITLGFLASFMISTAQAESDAQIFEHFAPWRAQYGIEIDFTPVIGCQDVVDYHKKLFAKMA